MNTSASLVSLHLMGEDKDDIALDTLPGKITITRTDAALTPYGPHRQHAHSRIASTGSRRDACTAG